MQTPILNIWCKPFSGIQTHKHEVKGGDVLQLLPFSLALIRNGVSYMSITKVNNVKWNGWKWWWIEQTGSQCNENTEIAMNILINLLIKSTNTNRSTNKIY